MHPVGLAVTVLRNRHAVKLIVALVAALLFALVIIVAAIAGVIEALLTAQEEQARRECSPGGSDYSYVSQEPSEAALADIPENYLEQYRSAAEEYNIDWAILAAIGSIESDHGRMDTGGSCIEGPPTPYGTAKGPMQFIDSTWATIGIDGNGDGEANACNYEDAIPSSAKYLVESGAPGDYYSAIFAYNRADWYVQDVMDQAEAYRAAEGGDSSGDGSEENSADDGPGEDQALATIPAAAAISTPFASPVTTTTRAMKVLPPNLLAGPEQLATRLISDQDSSDGDSGEGSGNESGGEDQAVFPTPESYMDSYTNDWGADRPQGGHEGTDVMGPNGEPLYAMVSGTIQQTSGSSASNWSEMGGWNIMLEADADVGPIRAGDRLYYAHLDEPPPVSPGDRVEAGDVIGTMGDTGYGPEGTRGQFPPHLHLGWYDASGGRAEAPSGAMNPFPLLEWLKENGGTASGDASDAPGGGSSSGSSVAPGVCEPQSEGGAGGTPVGGYSGGDGEPLSDGSVEDLIDHPNFEADPNSINDLQTGEIDPRLVSVLLRIVEEHSITVTAMKSNHPYGQTLPAELGGGANSHGYGLTADIGNIDGVPVLQQQTSEAVLNVGQILLDIPPSDRPDEIIGPTSWTAELGVTREDGFITDQGFTEAHNDHLHIGWSP